MGNVVVVTGGGTGIGRAIAERFVRDGATVLITGRRQELLDRAAAEIEAQAYAFDATDPEQVAAFAAAVGPVNVLVNNAGGNRDFDAAAPATLDEVAAAWQANFAANVLSAVLVTTALRPSMPAGGSIITIGSIAADKGAGSYGAAKAAIGSWNIDLARQAGGDGITANVVSPGYIADTEFFRDVLTDRRREQLVDAAMTGRAGAPRDIAGLVAFLASPDARQLTGQTLAVNGGEWPSR
ncbi:SDR family oxidoreductase [Pseudonocardiaceae bacterium YIM PH 21723]|nr:SDR family oxidoreductase [Pseudonocardiaceae bacterium YIM PH 21723]